MLSALCLSRRCCWYVFELRALMLVHCAGISQSDRIVNHSAAELVVLVSRWQVDVSDRVYCQGVAHVCLHDQCTSIASFQGNHFAFHAIDEVDVLVDIPCEENLEALVHLQNFWLQLSIFS